MLAAVAAVGLSSCGLLRSAAEAPGKVVSVLPGGKEVVTVDPNMVQVRLMRFADMCALEITESTREMAERAGTPEARIQALTWKIEYSDTLWRLAVGPQPFAALFETIVVISALRGAHETKWIAVWGEAGRPLLQSLVDVEKGVWTLAAEVLSEEQIGEVRAIVTAWLESDPTSRAGELSKLPAFVDLASPAQQGKSGLGGGLNDLMRLDPLSGLEPAVREVEQARRLAERAFYYLQRLSELLDARVELMVLRTSRSPEVQGSLANLDRVSGAAASFAATAEALPAALSAERQAAVSQIAAELTAQREGLVRDLETAQAPLAALLESTRATAEAGREMSAALTEMLRAADTLVARFTEKEEEPPAVPVAPPSEPSAEPAGRPFDITEYTAAADGIGRAAHELRDAIATLDRSMPQLERVIDGAAARVDQSVDHTFRRALELLAAALLGGAIAVLAVRFLTRRFQGRAAA